MGLATALLRLRLGLATAPHFSGAYYGYYGWGWRRPYYAYYGWRPRVYAYGW